MKLPCFKAYDIRGKLGEELNNDIAYRIGRAYADFLNPRTVVVGGDVRTTSITLKTALSSGLRDGGSDVLDIGTCGTEEIYFATSHLNCDGGIMVTASHNPIDYNGMKLVREESRPISGDTGLKEIQHLAEQGVTSKSNLTTPGSYQKAETFTAYLDHLLTYVNTDNLKPLKLVVNAGNGAAGAVIDGLESRLPFELIKVHHEPDPSFPNGIPNPLLPENRISTQNAVIEHNADMGLAWDGDFDRCFFFDENGQFIEGYYIVGLLAKAFLIKTSNGSSPEKIIHDPRLTWNTVDICKSFSAEAIMSKTGHAFIKERMRKEDAVYGGEMSAHHYFREFNYCDSGMIPWLLIAEMLCKQNQPLSTLVSDRITAFPCSGEINVKMDNPEQMFSRMQAHYGNQAVDTDFTDGISMNMGDWRFNLRASNTEPVGRLNVEAAGNKSILDSATGELLRILGQS